LIRYDLGRRQNGEEVRDVILPPWAKTPDEFIRCAFPSSISISASACTCTYCKDALL
jgi:hypothetical protein